MIASVCATDGGRVHACLPSHGESVIAVSSRGGGGEPGECLEVQPELADIVRGFADAEGATSGTAWCVAAGVSRVPDVGGIGGD